MIRRLGRYVDRKALYQFFSSALPYLFGNNRKSGSFGEVADLRSTPGSASPVGSFVSATNRCSFVVSATSPKLPLFLLLPKRYGIDH
jgi:hypothetical protein